MRLRLRLALLLVTVAAPLAAPVPVARGDADPPSDILILQNVYLPFKPKVSKPIGDQLTAVTTKANKAGFNVKVAIIASSVDLGAVPGYFGRPQQYASFLFSELTQTGVKTLLTVMPAGFGVMGGPDGADKALNAVAIPPKATSDQLATSAIAAVSRLSAAAGHPVGGAKGGSSSGGGASPLLVFGLPVVMVALAALALRLRSRGEHSDPTKS